jgi:hypothetical protein
MACGLASLSPETDARSRVTFTDTRGSCGYEEGTAKGSGGELQERASGGGLRSGIESPNGFWATDLNFGRFVVFR